MFKSLRVKLSVILISLAVLPLLVTVILLTHQSVTYLERNTREILSEVSASVAQEIKFFIDDHTDQLLQTHRLHGIERISLAKQRSVLNNLLFDRQAYEELALADARGSELVRLSRSTVYTEDDLLNLADVDVFRIPTRSQRPYFGNIRFNQKIQEPLASISVPIYDLGSGALEYVLMGELRLKKIWGLLDKIHRPEESTVYVIDQSGQVVAHPNPSVVLRGTIADSSQTAAQISIFNGKDVLLSKRQIQFGNQKLTIVAEQPVSRALLLVRKHLTIAVAVTAIVLVAAVIIALVAIKRIITPIQMLAHAAREISLGNYSQTAHVASQDEIGLLASAFNHMSMELTTYQNRMEELVRMRTEELDQAKEQLEADIEIRKVLEQERENLIKNLEASLEKVKLLSGFLPICASCKKIRDDKGYWNQIEEYIRDHSEAEFSHGLCPDCLQNLYPKLYPESKDEL